MRDLGSLGGANSQASDINDAGQIVGESELPDPGPGGLQWRRAFLYEGIPGINGVMHDLGTLGGPGSYANAINNLGFIVGKPDRATGQFPRTLALWRPDRSVVDLEAWLASVNPQQAAHWSFDDVYDISDTGWITGDGDYNDGPGGLPDGIQGFLLNASSLIPEPAGIFSILVILPLSLRRRRN